MFKFTPAEIEEMEKMILDFAKDSRKPFLSGTEKEIREIELDGRRYCIILFIDEVDEGGQ